MAFETINLGTQPAGTGGDTARSAFEKTNRNFLAVDVLSAAMSQAQFEAIRAQNKEKYAASGWVSFGNHESGKQVNECKPGLYTSITTPNTLLIGKAGGVGGSKTDHASVHIDGVVFNLTNQFVLTLPSHPTSTLPERMDMYGVESEKVEISAASPNAYQGGLRGVGAAVNLFTATDQQKKDFFSANANTTYIGTDGKIYQWQLYKVSFAGATDGVPSPTEQGYTLNSFGDLWLKSGKNLLYFGNALRLNDGGYHPSFNPLGAAKFVGDTFWHNTAASITSKADCFDPAKLLAGSGSIASGKSGRPETGGRYYDVIYADGFGGVCRDMRYHANGVDAADFAEAYSNIKSARYRGFEKVLRTSVIDDQIPSKPNMFLMNGKDSWTYFNVSASWQNIPLSKGYVLYSDNSFYEVTLYSDTSLNIVWTNYGNLNSELSSKNLLFVILKSQEKFEIGGKFCQTDVISSPDKVLSNQNLSKGWIGDFINEPNVTSPVKLNRKNLLQNCRITYYRDFDGVWAMIPEFQFNQQSNTTGNITKGDIVVTQYQAFAKQTENYQNYNVSENYNGVGKVSSFGGYLPEYGCILLESLIGKIPTGFANMVYLSSVKNIGFLSDGKLYSDGDYPITHDSLQISSANINSTLLKVLNYNVLINNQAFVQFAYTELKYNGTSWGDDGKVTIVDNQSTKTDLNGNTVLVGTAKLKEPIGWIKNKV
ncbi:hypothetical protein ACE02U_09160 [Shewanella xiamenensis]|uniref:hypothetical protein n=1 Tax=Shewanella xiamenensis TaxID=332186 RepID=UPI0035BA0354